MIFVVWEDANNCINSVISTVNSKFPKEARYFLGKKPQAAELELLTKPPFVFTGWLISANRKTKLSVLKQLNECRSNNIILIRVDSQAQFDEQKERLTSTDAKFFDNHNVSKTQVLQWIKDELPCTDEIAKYLYNRVGGYMRELVFAVQNLKRSGKEISRKTIRELVDKNDTASMFDIAEYLIGVQHDRVKPNDVFSTLYKFRYAESWILETLTKELTLYKKVFDLVASCEMDITNYAAKVKLCEDKSIRDMPIWKLKRIILNYGKTSMERIVLIKSMLNDIGKSYFDIIKILQIVSIGGY